MFSIYAVVSNVRGDSCEGDSKCDDSLFVRVAIANKIYDENSINIQNYLLATFILTFLFMLQYLIYIMRKNERKSDELINSPSDYSILVSQLPEGTTDRDLLKMVVEERPFLTDDNRKLTDNLSVRDIIMSYQTADYIETI